MQASGTDGAINSNTAVLIAEKYAIKLPDGDGVTNPSFFKELAKLLAAKHISSSKQYSKYDSVQMRFPASPSALLELVLGALMFVN